MILNQLEMKHKQSKINSKAIIDEAHELINEAQTIKNNSKSIRDELNELTNDAQAIKNNSKSIRDEAQVLIDKNKINKKISSINKLNKILPEVSTKVTNKIKPIYESMRELQDEIYNGPCLRLVELNKIKDILDDALNFVSKDIYGQKMTPKIINIDKNKDIDRYVDKLTDVIDNYIKLINKIVDTMCNVICDINNEANMIDEIINKASGMDNDALHLIYDKLNKIIAQAKKKLKTKKKKIEKT